MTLFKEPTNGSGDMLSTNNLSDVSNASTSLANLGGEPAFSKNTAFNKNLGTTAGTVLEGNTTTISAGESTKLGHISVTQAVDLDTIESDTNTNNAKVGNATHTGDATGSTALTLATVNSDVGSFTKPSLTINAKGLVTAAASEIIGGVTLSSSSSTDILDGTYVILADTTVVTSVTSGVGQDSNWTLEITQAGITNQKGVVTATVNLEKDGGGGANYDIAIFKNGSIIAESEQVDQKLESTGKGQSVTVMSIVEFSTSDTFDISVSGNGTADDIFCGGGTLFIR